MMGGATMSLERVVVTGLGVVASNAHGTAAFAQALREGKSGIRFIESLKALNLRCQVGGIPEGIDAIAPRYLAEDELLTMNTNMVYAAIASIDAWNDAGLARIPAEAGEPDWDTGAIVGTGLGGVESVGAKLVPRTDAGKAGSLGSSMIEQTMCSGNSARLGGLLGLGNQVTTNSSACSTGTEAVVDSFHRIRTGQAKRMLAGGSDGASQVRVGELRRAEGRVPDVQPCAREGVASDERDGRRLRALVGRGRPAAREPLFGARSAARASTPRSWAATSTAAGSEAAGR